MANSPRIARRPRVARLAPIGLLLVLPGLAASATDRAGQFGQSIEQNVRQALSLPRDPRRGAESFEHYCSRCPGPGGGGDASRTIPALAGQRFAYLVRQLAGFSSGERDSRVMHGIVSRASLREPQSWTDLAAYLSENAPPVGTVQIGDGRGRALGRGIYHEQCASCHGADARGDAGGAVPALRHQHYDYLVNQMHQLAEGRRHDMDPGLVRFLQSFDDRDIAAVADYLYRLPAVPPRHDPPPQGS